MTRLQQWRIFCATCTVPWPVMPFGSMQARTSCRMPRWLSSAALWTASSNWPSTPIRMEIFSETSEWLLHLPCQVIFWYVNSTCAMLVSNGVVFVARRLFHEHIQRLSKVVTANHKALQIPEVLSWWLSFPWCIHKEQELLLLFKKLKYNWEVNLFSHSFWNI